MLRVDRLCCWGKEIEGEERVMAVHESGKGGATPSNE